MPDDKFVTVLKSSDAGFVDIVAANLDAEGIRYQHPGKNHAALIPGVNFIEIDLRVPEQNAADARTLIDKLRMPDAPAGALVAFRVRQTYRALGAILGTIGGMIWLNVEFSEAPELVRAATLGGSICAGFLLGRAISRDSCSLPGCRAKLNRFDLRCSNCGAELRGVISSARKHFAAVER